MLAELLLVLLLPWRPKKKGIITKKSMKIGCEGGKNSTDHKDKHNKTDMGPFHEVDNHED